MDLLPGLDIDQRLVGAGLLGSFVADDADVVRVAQQLEERGTAHRPRRALRGGYGGESARCGLGEQADDGVLAGCVLLEYPPHQRGAFAAERGVKPPAAAVLIHLQEVHALAPGATAGTRIA